MLALLFLSDLLAICSIFGAVDSSVGSFAFCLQVTWFVMWTWVDEWKTVPIRSRCWTSRRWFSPSLAQSYASSSRSAARSSGTTALTARPVNRSGSGLRIRTTTTCTTRSTSWCTRNMSVFVTPLNDGCYLCLSSSVLAISDCNIVYSM